MRGCPEEELLRAGEQAEERFWTAYRTNRSYAEARLDTTHKTVIDIQREVLRAVPDER